MNYLMIKSYCSLKMNITLYYNFTKLHEIFKIDVRQMVRCYLLKSLLLGIFMIKQCVAFYSFKTRLRNKSGAFFPLKTI